MRIHAARSDAAGLLAGIVAGFALAVLLGYQAATYSKPANFVRFQHWTDPRGIFYPPFRMLEHLALARWRPGQTVVIVAGNSIFNGVYQQPEEIWTRRLQEFLGPEHYVVVNLSFVGARPTEAGVLVAESLLRRNIPVIVVTNTGLRPPERAIDGLYGYYYWQASAQSALLPHPARDADFARREAELDDDARRAAAEQRRAAALNARLYFQELWHEVALHHGFTVWNHLAADEFWRPRDEWPDREPDPKPLAVRFLERTDAEMRIVRNISESTAEPDPAGGWRFSAASAAEIGARIEAAYAPALRPRLLLVLCQSAPYYRNLLTADERARDLAAYDGCAAAWRRHGIACLSAGLDFEDADYSDRAHLTASGGRKLAALVADEVRRLAPPPTPPPL